MSKQFKLIFVINKNAGSHTIDYTKTIEEHLKDQPQVVYRFFTLSPECKVEEFQKMCHDFQPETVVAVGGDGTVKFVAEQLMHTSMALGIIPAGSANGLAKDLNIPGDLPAAMKQILIGNRKRIHLLEINDEICIHLSDLGFNAHTVKKFKDQDQRGMKGYIQASWKVLWAFRRMRVRMDLGNKTIHKIAIMVVLANARQYGTGVVINPQGDLQDDYFEVVVVRKVSFSEILKMTFTKWALNPKKTVLFKTRSLHLQVRHPQHFQIDGEYIGKVKEVRVKLIPACLSVIF